MAGRRFRAHSNRNLGSVMASFFVVVAGFIGCLFILLSTGASTVAIFGVSVLFALVALIPIWVMIPSWSEVRAGFISLGYAVAALFIRERKRQQEHFVWKRRRTKHISTPHGAEYYSTFVPEPSERRKGDGSPPSGG